MGLRAVADRREAEIRSRAAPMGMSVIVSSASRERAGLCCSGPTSAVRSIVHAGIFRAVARNSMGAVWAVKGCSASGTFLRITANDLAGVFTSSTRP